MQDMDIQETVATDNTTAIDNAPELTENLARFSIAGRVLWRLWHQAPDQGLLEDIPLIIDEWPLSPDHPEIGEGVKLMHTAIDGTLDSLTRDYADLFIGPDRLKAAPWASVYLTEEQTTFGEPTLAVRDFYQQYGMQIETGENEPDDHIGLMFAFIAWLSEQGLMAADNRPLEPVYCILRSFLSEHLLTWAHRLCDVTAEHAATDFYRGLAKVTGGTLDVMAETVQANTNSVKLYSACQKTHEL